MDETPPGLTLSALREYDPIAWKRCFDWLSPIAKKAARLKLPGYLEADVDDVASEAMGLMVNHVLESQDLSGLGPWVREITKRKAIDHFRSSTAGKRDRRLELSLEEELDNSDGKPFSHDDQQPDQQVERRERNAQLQAAMQRLKPLWRDLLVGFQIEQLSYEELALRHDMPINSIGPNLKRAMASLRSIIENDPVLNSFPFLLLLSFLLLHLFFPRP